MPNLIPFNRSSTPTPSEPFVTIQKGGKIMTMNLASYELLGSPEGVELSYDPDEKIVGVRPMNLSSPIAYQVRQMGRSTTVTIGTQHFVTFNKIDVSQSIRRGVTKWKEYILIDLKEEGVIVSSSHNNK